MSKSDYLKKYLEDGEKIKKKKKSKSTKSKTQVKIIDDDGVNDCRNSDIEEEILFGGEDAPQIVEMSDSGILETRPEFVKNTFTTLGSNRSGESLTRKDLLEMSLKRKSGKDDLNSGNMRSDKSPRKDRDFSPPRMSRRDCDLSPKRGKHSDNSPPRRKRSPDNSPPRRKRSPDNSPARRQRSSDNSPPRRKRSPDNSPKRRGNTDSSPPRRKKSPANSSKRQRSSDNSPPRRKRSPDNFSPKRIGNPEKSPPRRKRSPDNSPPRRQKSRDNSPNRKLRSPDNSPPRRRKNADNSPPRRQRNPDNSPHRRQQSRDTSPNRKQRSPDNSPPRRRKNTDNSPPRRERNLDNSPKNRDKSPPRKSRWNVSPRKDQSSPPTNPFKDSDSRKDKMSTTLDGKRSGLQNAKDLKSEIKNLKSRENEVFDQMFSEFSGRDAEVQTRKTSRKRVQESPTKVLEREKREQENKEKYTRWGKGLKQIEAIEQKVQDFHHEASKPLARYSNDDDLEEMLKQQERAGDPMLQYMREKKEKTKDTKALSIPVYKGPYPENRFNIRPGYRWDGLDRSNGYEKKLFEIQNTKRAAQEDSYKYSTEDM